MEINFKGPVMPIDPYSQLAFVEILNIILTAGHIVDVNRFLIRRNVNPRFGSLSGYFRWSFAEDRFTLWQRTDYNSTMCFSHRILDLPFGVLAAKDNGKETELLNGSGVPDPEDISHLGDWMADVRFKRVLIWC